MQVGDLVKFETKAWVMQRDDYANPGIVLGVRKDARGKTRARVIWCDGRITFEHACYLKPLTSSLQ